MHVLFAEDLVDLGDVGEHTSTGVDDGPRRSREHVRARAGRRTATGIDAATIRRIARELAAAPAAAVYARIGTCTQEFGTLASWLVDVLNVLTGNLDRPGGAMFAKPATGSGNTGGTRGQGPRRAVRPPALARARAARVLRRAARSCASPRRSRRPATGQVRALVTIAGNPVLSTPDADRLDRALDTLEFMVSVDIYLNETTRHADVFLPAEPELARGHYDLALYNLAIRNVANYSPPLSASSSRARVAEWQILLRLAAILSGQGADADIDALDDFVITGLVQKAVTRRGSNVEGRDPDELLKELASRRGPERILDFMLRTGPYGDGFGADPDGLTLAKLEENPHGIDFGPLQPRMPEVLRTPTGKIELAPDACLDDVARLRRSARPRPIPSSCSSAGATCARTTRGCTTCRCS